MLIGIVGFAGSGKGTVGKTLVKNHGFISDSFAAPLKDAVAAIFGWDRELLEGDSKESRIWRERPDKFWSKEMEDPKFTPRKAMQVMGTDALRNHVYDKIWVASLVKRWQDAGQPDTVVTDCRFSNEVDIIHSLGGKVIRVQRGPEPSWYQTILFHNRGHSDDDEKKQIEQLRILDTIPHESETAWIGCQVDYLINNEEEIIDLEKAVAKIIPGNAQTSLDI